ncbi:hypothetical protein KP509_07G018100 [Ceratopteris richardii]|nr:hypothetical protein KP509_07G018100 [Ceratopteris richardii]
MQKDQVYIVDGVLNKTVHNILRKVKVLLLPVEFVLGILVPSLPAKVFSVKETDLIEFNQLFHFEETSQMSVQQIQDSYSNDLAIRLSGHLRILDLAGCQQVTVAVLFHSLLQYLKQNSNNDVTLYEKLEAEIYSIFVHGSVTHSPMNQEFFTMTSLKNVCEINFQGCWRLDQNRLVHWLHVACPNLKVLNISQCPQLNVDILPQILKGCKYVEVLNASLNILRTQVELSSDRISMHIFNQDSCKYEGYLCSLTNLSFEGRNHLKDSDLYLLTRYCLNLSTINFGGCSQLTDKGLSIFLSSIRNLTKLQVPYTAFGRLSVNAVLGFSCEQHSDELWSDKIQSDFYTRECALATLDLEGCLNIDRDSISQLIKEAPLLENLNLGFLSLDDSTLLCFSGTSLNNLNLQETQVTEYGIAHILKWNQHLNSLNIRGCKKITSALAFKISDTIRKQDALNIGMAETSTLKCLAAGWGFTDSTFMALKPSLRHLQSFSLGLGSRISECVLSNLHEILPQLEDLSLVFQAISGSCMLDLLKHGQALKRLELCHCFVELSHEIIHVMPTALTSLRLERGIEWMTDADIELLVSKHQTLTSLYLTGCKNLTPRSLETISKSWQAMTYLTLKECGTMTLNGGGCLFVCKALKHLTLQHSGAGLDKDFVKCALVELPVLQNLCLDICDSKNGGFNDIKAQERRSLQNLKFTRCTTLRNSFNGFARRHYKDSIVIEWHGNVTNSRVVKEGL